VLITLLGALAIGVSLGLLGSGGSILTVPVLHYLVGQPDKLAIGGSLLVVGVIAAAATLPYARSRQVDWRNVLWFGVPGMAGAWAGATLAHWVPGAVQMALFAGVMLLAAWRMLRGGVVDRPDHAGRARCGHTREPRHSPRRLRSVTISPAMPQLSVATSSITTTVVAGFLPRTRRSNSVAPAISSAFCSLVTPSSVIRMLTYGI
jgi:uncharacterized membrane protein YfcA